MSSTNFLDDTHLLRESLQLSDVKVLCRKYFIAICVEKYLMYVVWKMFELCVKKPCNCINSEKSNIPNSTRLSVLLRIQSVSQNNKTVICSRLNCLQTI